jgi:tetratricopeptide (TPR) repeat protein
MTTETDSGAAPAPSFDFTAAIAGSEALLRQGRWNEALALTRAALPPAPQQARLLFHLARAHDGLGQPLQAIPLLERAVSLDPDLTEGRQGLIRLYARTRQWERALSLAEELCPRVSNPELLEAEIAEAGLRMFLAVRGRDSAAPQLQITPEDALGALRYHYAAKRYWTTEAVSRICLAGSGSSDQRLPLPLLVWSAAALARLGRNEPLLERMSRIVAAGPQQAGNLLAQFANVTAGWEEGPLLAFLRAYAGAAEAAGNLAHLIQAAQGLFHSHHSDEALALIERTAALAPDNAEVLFSRARLLLRTGAMEPAVAAYQDLISRHPEHWLAHYDLVRLLRLLERYQEADVYEQRQQALPRSDGDTLSFHELGQTAIVDMTEVANSAGKAAQVRKYWHRTDTIRFFPSSFEGGPLPQIVRQAFFHNGRFLPAPVFRKEAQLVTFGSCFATYLRRFLAARGRTSETIQIAEELNNTWALRSYIGWCLTGDQSHISYWYETAENRYTPPRPYEEYRDLLQQADGFVLTLGLGEVWRDKVSGGVFWKGIPESVFQEDRHEIVLSTVEENYDNIRTIADLFQAHCGDKPLIFTVSPVPLKATFRGMSCMEADCLSKSVLRLAIDRLMAEGRPNIYYWPSFEIVRWMGAHLERSPYGNGRMGQNGTRHVQHDVIDAIVNTFIGEFFSS